MSVRPSAARARPERALTALGVLLALFSLSPFRPLPGQAASQPQLTAMAVRLASIPAVTGYERSMVDTLLRLIPGSTRDRAGNVRVQLGGRSARRLLVCPLDEPGFVVGRIRVDGYLTLRRVPGRVSPLFDQQIEGQRVTIYGRTAVPGVVAVRSIHLTRGRSTPGELPFTVDDAYVDLGAQSRAQVGVLGVHVLSPVTLTKEPHAYGKGLLAAPAVGRRAACAALVLALSQSRLRAKLLQPVTVAFAVEQELSQRGLATLASELGPFDETVLLDGGAGRWGAVIQERDTSASTQWPRLGKTTRWSLPVRYRGTPVETLALADADSLRSALVRWIGGEQ
jgi:putative aminopeptidase